MKAMRKQLLALLTAVALCIGIGAAPPARSGGIPVFDAVNYAVLLEQLKELGELYKLTKEQLKLLTEELQAVWEVVKFASWTYDALTGKWDIEAWARRKIEQAAIRALNQSMPGAYRDFRSLYDISTRASDDLLSVVRRKRGYQPLLPEWMIEKGGDREAELWRDRQMKIEAAHAASELAYDTIAGMEAHLVDLQTQIPNTTDVSGALRLQNRISAARGMIEAEKNKAQMTAQILAAQRAQEDVEGIRRWKCFVSRRMDGCEQ